MDIFQQLKDTLNLIQSTTRSVDIGTNTSKFSDSQLENNWSDVSAYLNEIKKELESDGAAPTSEIALKVIENLEKHFPGAQYVNEPLANNSPNLLGAFSHDGKNLHIIVD